MVERPLLRLCGFDANFPRVAHLQFRFPARSAGPGCPNGEKMMQKIEISGYQILVLNFTSTKLSKIFDFKIRVQGYLVSDTTNFEISALDFDTSKMGVLFERI